MRTGRLRCLAYSRASAPSGNDHEGGGEVWGSARESPYVQVPAARIYLFVGQLLPSPSAGHGRP
jgi:hypothetical protein